MARLHCSSLNGRGIADFDEFIHKKFPIILRSCLEALYFDPTTLIEIAVYLTLNVVQGFHTLPNLAVVRVCIFTCKRGNTEIFAQIETIG